MRITYMHVALTATLGAAACDDPALFTSDLPDQPDEVLRAADDLDDPDEASLPARTGGKGMTWAKLGHDPTRGVDHLGCAHCDAYAGDTPCTLSLPVVCIRQDGSPAPAGLSVDFHNGWTHGHIATTRPIHGTALTSLQTANQLCADNFGPGWRMAEFHDGSGGWNWYAYGNVRGDMRMWVYINDQPSNCWNP